MSLYVVSHVCYFWAVLILSVPDDMLVHLLGIPNSGLADWLALLGLTVLHLAAALLLRMIWTHASGSR